MKFSMKFGIEWSISLQPRHGPGIRGPLQLAFHHIQVTQVHGQARQSEDCQEAEGGDHDYRPLLVGGEKHPPLLHNPAFSAPPRPGHGSMVLAILPPPTEKGHPQGQGGSIRNGLTLGGADDGRPRPLGGAEHQAHQPDPTLANRNPK